MNYLKASYLRIPLLLLALFLSACTTLNHPRVDDKDLPKNISQLNYWTVKGKVLIKTDTEKLSGYFYWQKQKDEIEFSLNTFIGTNMLKLTTKDNISTLTFDGNTYQGTSPSELILATTGIQLPLEHLEYWIKGKLTGTEINIAAKGKQIKQFDYLTKKRSLTPSQKWHVKYKDYKKQAIYSLPMSISLQEKSTKLKLAVSGWEF